MQLADQIEAWLTQQGITARDYRTGQPEGGEDQILHWGTEMGPQPTAAQLSETSATAGLALARGNQIAKINAACQAALAAITAPYPASEALTWDQQLVEAQAYSASSSAQVPLLSAIAEASNRALGDLATAVLNANATYKAASGAAIGRRQALTAQINAAMTAEAVAAITW
jgi:hypothetical protein